MARELIVMRLDEMFKRHPKQIERKCARCGEVVGIYPSGQKIIKENPEINIVCTHCIDWLEMSKNADKYKGMDRDMDMIYKEMYESQFYEIDKDLQRKVIIGMLIVVFMAAVSLAFFIW
jgi:uncharacterized Fe-S center protein